jgi:DNA (cytosine-5)-methyltransferase 1
MFTGLALCAGAGGMELGLGIALPEYRTVCYVERDAYASAALVARMEDKALCDAPVWSDLAAFDGATWRGCVDIVTAGYPCQPFSDAGKKLAEEDPRHLWPHVRRVLAECGASVLFAENVPGHVGRGLENVRNDLLGMGYRLAAGIFSAAQVGASHIRKRLFLLAYADCEFLRLLAAHLHTGWENQDNGGGASAFHPHGGQSLDNAVPARRGENPYLFPPVPYDFTAWEDYLSLSPDAQPAIFRGPDGLAPHVDSLRLAGNGVVPLAAAYAFRTLLLAELSAGDG